MRKLILVLFLCLFTTPVFCEIEDGRWWNKLQRADKVYYIIGFSTAYIRGKTDFYSMERNYTKKAKEKKNPYDHYPYEYNYGEIVDVVDKFYSNPQYRTITLESALDFVIFPALSLVWSQEQIDKQALVLLKVGDITYMVK